MSRTFWFLVGAGSGVYAMVKTRRAAQRLTPAELSHRLGAAGVGMRAFGQEVRLGMAERENQLREQLQQQTGLTTGRTTGDTSDAGARALTAAAHERGHH